MILKVIRRLFMRLFVFLFICQLPIYLYSQIVRNYHKDSGTIEKCALYTVQIPQPPMATDANKKTLPVSKIEIRDTRFDTSYIGIQVKSDASWANRLCRKIVLNQPASSAIASYVNNNSNFPLSDTPYSLLCFLKEFRVTQKDSVNKNTNKHELYNRIVFNTEVFLSKNDTFFPAFKIDTLLLGLIGEADEFGVLPNILDRLLQKCALINVSEVEKKHPYTETDLKSRYYQKFQKPILTTVKPETGIYKSFNEFVSNNPSIKKIELKTDGKLTTLYGVSPQGELTLATKAFGFCDGKNIWINVKNVYYPLIRHQNTFEFIGDSYAIDYRAGNRLDKNYLPRLSKSGSFIAEGAASVLVATSSMSAKFSGQVIHQLNPETGEIY